MAGTLSRSAVFDLDTIEIDGAFGAEADQVAEASGLVVGTPMLDLDLGAPLRDCRVALGPDGCRRPSVARHG